MMEAAKLTRCLCECRVGFWSEFCFRSSNRRCIAISAGRDIRTPRVFASICLACTAMRSQGTRPQTYVPTLFLSRTFLSTLGKRKDTKNDLRLMRTCFSVIYFYASNSIHVETFKWLAFWVNICERYLHCLFLMFVVSPFCCTISPVIWNSRGYHRDFYLENSLYAAITGNWSKNNLDRLSSFSKNGKFTIDLLSLGMLCMHQDPQFPIADPTFCGAFKTTIRPGWNGEL